FREDLFYRINVIPLNLPPLREREGDVELLTHYFLNQHTSRIGIVYPGLAPEVMALLKGYRWPGNVRELSNLIEYLVNVSQAGEVIDASLLPPNIIRNQEPQRVTAQSIPVTNLDAAFNVPAAAQLAPISEKLPEPVPGESGLESMEKQMIEETLQRLGNKKLVAQALGIGIATLYRKIKKYEIAVQS
ncbi:MAG: helix-turn-helix domain-containing protein, partial [Aeromonas veronii]